MYMSFPTCMTFFLLWKMKEDILKSLFVPFVYTMKVNGVQNNTRTHPYVPQKKESHTCLEWHEGG